MCKKVFALAVALAVVVSPLGPTTASAQFVPSSTTSYYERSTNLKTLYLQGKAAGRAAAQGIVILDFGRPAYDGVSYGTMAYSGAFIPFSSIATSVESYIAAYYRYAPAGTNLNVAIGTNNSCGTGQPCGEVASCGCPDEPTNYLTWGAQFAGVVEQVGAWASELKSADAFTDVVRVIAADDAEPAYDPEYENTYDVLAGYAGAVGGTFPTMVDYGSAEGDFWTEAELLQVAYGFRPDVPMPQIYYPFQAGQWAALMIYAKRERDEKMAIFGVLTTGAGTNDPATAYADMVGVASDITDQTSIPWLSTIHR